MALELLISKFLRIGVLCSGTLLASGWLVTMLSQSETVSELQHNRFARFAAYVPVSLFEMTENFLARGDWGNMLMSGGLFVLLLLPALRVLMTALMLLRQQEFLLSLCAATVLFGLLVGAYLGITH